MNVAVLSVKSANSNVCSCHVSGSTLSHTVMAYSAVSVGTIVTVNVTKVSQVLSVAGAV